MVEKPYAQQNMAEKPVQQMENGYSEDDFLENEHIAEYDDDEEDGESFSQVYFALHTYKHTHICIYNVCIDF